MIDAGDEHIANPVQHRSQRQQDRVGAAREEAVGEMRGQEQAKDQREEWPDIGGQRGVPAEVHQRVGRHRDDCGQHDKRELGAASSSANHGRTPRLIRQPPSSLLVPPWSSLVERWSSLSLPQWWWCSAYCRVRARGSSRVHRSRHRRPFDR